MNMLNMYKEMQVTADINKSSKKDLLLMMYDAVIQNLTEAVNAIASNNTTVKIKKIEKVLSIIELGLIMSLSKDGAKEVAESLELFYEDAATRLVLGNLKNDTKLITEIKNSFVDLRKCWEKVAD
jgi:flagellar biosynthetic protein FliS